MDTLEFSISFTVMCALSAIVVACFARRMCCKKPQIRMPVVTFVATDTFEDDDCDEDSDGLLTIDTPHYEPTIHTQTNDEGAPSIVRPTDRVDTSYV